MDFIANLASKLGLEESAAQAVAGSAMKLVQGAVQKEGGEGAASELAAAVPEMEGWKAQAAAATESGDGGGLLGDLLGGAGGGMLGGLAGAIGGEDAANAAALVGVLSKFGLDADKAALAAPVIMGFLKERLSPELLGLVSKAAPFLAGGDENKDEGGGFGAITGALGGLFGD